LKVGDDEGIQAGKKAVLGSRYRVEHESGEVKMRCKGEGYPGHRARAKRGAE